MESTCRVGSPVLSHTIIALLLRSHLNPFLTYLPLSFFSFSLSLSLLPQWGWCLLEPSVRLLFPLTTLGAWLHLFVLLLFFSTRRSLSRLTVTRRRNFGWFRRKWNEIRTRLDFNKCLELRNQLVSNSWTHSCVPLFVIQVYCGKKKKEKSLT